MEQKQNGKFLLYVTVVMQFAQASGAEAVHVLLHISCNKMQFAQASGAEVCGNLALTRLPVMQFAQASGAEGQCDHTLNRSHRCNSRKRAEQKVLRIAHFLQRRDAIRTNAERATSADHKQAFPHISRSTA